MNVDQVPFWIAAAALFSAVLRASAPIVFASMGALVSDLAGVVNVGIEGLMLVAAFFGVVGSAFAPQWLPTVSPWVWPLVGAAMGLAAAVILALVLGFFHLELGADLIVAGIGINLLAAGLTVFLMVSISGDKGSTASLASLALPPLHIPGLRQWPLIDAWINGDSGAGHHALIWIAFVSVAVVAQVLFKTRFGLRLRAVGENQDAALSAGLSVKGLQYGALAASGLLAGLGGIYLSMGYLTLFQADMTAGRGFLALAAIFLGARRPLGTLGAALLFGAATALAAQLGMLNVSSQVIYMLPPIVTLLALVVAAERRGAIQRRTIRRRLHLLNERAL